MITLIALIKYNNLIFFIKIFNFILVKIRLVELILNKKKYFYLL